MDIKGHVRVGKDGSAEFGGAQQPTPGAYLGRYDEGIDLVTSDDGKRRINIPVTVIEGDNDGKRFYISVFVDGEEWMRERSFDQLCAIIDKADLADFFTKKYSAYDTLLDDAIISNVVDDLKIKLTDKVAHFTTEMQKSKGGEGEFIRVRKINSPSKNATGIKASPQAWDEG